jgi:putative hemolysin
MKRSLTALTILFCIALVIAVVLPAASTVQASNPSTVQQSEDGARNAVEPGTTALSEDADDTAKAAEYCVNEGGEVEVREPYFNTNDIEQNWLQLSGSRQFCQFTKGMSRIHVLLTTLYSKTPTLAALAYYAEVPYNTTCNGNPASCYCSQLGGTDLFGGININGGGWVLKSAPIDIALEACIFPDMSTIDSWGLTYHQAGIIRGRNLENVLRYPNPYKTK